jgi:MFS family permease
MLVLKPETLLGAGALLAAVALLLATFARGYTELFGALVLLGAALGLMLPGNLASLSLRAGLNAQGKAVGLNVVGQGMGLAIGPLAGAALHQISPQMPFLAAAILVMAAFVLATGASRMRTFPTIGEAVR